MSWLADAVQLQAVNPVSGEPVRVFNLVSGEGLRRLIMGIVPNFMNFAPLGPVLVCLLGLSVAEQSGLLGAVVRLPSTWALSAMGKPIAIKTVATLPMFARARP